MSLTVETLTPDVVVTLPGQIPVALVEGAIIDQPHQLLVPEGASVQLRADNGGVLILAEPGEFSFTDLMAMLDGVERPQSEQPLATDLDEVAVLQQQILDGVDPTRQFEAAAAGEPLAGAIGSAASAFVGEREGRQHLAVGGLDTLAEMPGLDSLLADTDELRLDQLLYNPNDAPTSLTLGDQNNLDGQSVMLDIHDRFYDADLGVLGTIEQLTFTAQGLPPGLSIDPLSGVISGTLDSAASKAGTYIVTITATDNSGASTAQSFSWNIVNPDPEFISGNDSDGSVPNDDRYSFSATEGAEQGQVVGRVSGGDADNDGVSYRFANGTLVSGLFTIDAATGEIRLNQNIDDADMGRYSLEVEVVDAQGATDSATVQIDLNNQNDAPTSAALSDQHNLDGEPISLDLRSYFDDADFGAAGANEPLTFSATGLPPGLTIDPQSGVISGIVDNLASDAGSYTVTVTATDRSGASTEQTFSWGIQNPGPEFISGNDSDGSAANDDRYSFSATEGAEQGQVVGRVSGVDADNDGVSYRFANGTLVSGLFTIDAATGEIRLNQNIDDADMGRYSLEVEVVDGQGATDSATVQIDLNNQNDAPTSTALSDQHNLDGEPISLDLRSYFDDADFGAAGANEQLTFSATGLPPGLTIDPQSGVISGIVDNNASEAGSYTVTVTATDRSGVSTEQTFSWGIQNPGPEFISGNDSGGSAANDDSYSFKAREGAKRGKVLGKVTAHDADGDEVSYSFANGTQIDGFFAIDAKTGEISLIKKVNDARVGRYELDVVVTDTQGSTDTATVSINLKNRNDAPKSTALDNQNNVDGEIINLDLRGHFKDADFKAAGANEQLTFSATGLPPGLTIDPQSGVISGIVDNNASEAGSYTVTVTATDRSGASTEQTFSWGIENPGPEFISGWNNDGSVDNDDRYHFSVEEGAQSGQVVGRVTAVDEDHDGLSFRFANGTQVSGLFTIDAATGEIRLNQNIDDADMGRYSLEVEVVDGQGATDHADVTITLNNQNDAPTSAALSDQHNLDGEPISLDLRSYFDDADFGAAGANEQLTFSATGLPPGLTIDPQSGVISGIVDNLASDAGSYTVTVTATDRSGASTEQTFNWGIENPGPEFISGNDSDGTVANDDYYSFSADKSEGPGSVVGKVQARDVDHDGVRYSFAGGTLTSGFFAINALTGEIYLNPSLLNAQAGEYGLSVLVTDAQGAIDRAQVNITLTDQLATEADQLTVVEGSTSESIFSVLDNDSGGLKVRALSADGGVSEVEFDLSTGVLTLVTAQGGKVIMQQDGSFVYIAPVVDNSAGTVTDSFLYKLFGPQGETRWTQVTLHVSDTGVTAEKDTLIVQPDGSVAGGNVLTNDHALDSSPEEPLQVTRIRFGQRSVDVSAGERVEIAGADGVLTIDSDGQYSYRPYEPAETTTEVSLARSARGLNDVSELLGADGRLNLEAASEALVSETGAGLGVGEGNSNGISGEEVLIVGVEAGTTGITAGLSNANGNDDILIRVFDSAGNEILTGVTVVFHGQGNKIDSVSITSEIEIGYLAFTLKDGGQGHYRVVDTATLTKPGDENISDEFIYTVQDQDGSQADASLTITGKGSHARPALKGKPDTDQAEPDDTASAMAAGGSAVVAGVMAGETEPVSQDAPVFTPNAGLLSEDNPLHLEFSDDLPAWTQPGSDRQQTLIEEAENASANGQGSGAEANDSLQIESLLDDSADAVSLESLLITALQHQGENAAIEWGSSAGRELLNPRDSFEAVPPAEQALDLTVIDPVLH